MGCLLLAGCGPAKPPTAAAGPNPAATSSAATPATTGGGATGGGGDLTACGLITEQDASTAIGSAAGPGTANGTAALSSCNYAQGALNVSMKTDSEAFYDQSHADAHANGATDLPGVGDSAFVACIVADQACTLLFLKGTTLVSILFSGAGAHDIAVALAKIAASKL